MAGPPAGNARGMPDLLRLPLRAADLALAPTRFAIRTVRGLLPFGHGHDEAPAPWPADAPPEPVAPPPPAAAKPRARTANGATATPARPNRGAAARPKPSPKAARRAVRHEPTRGEAAALREERREEEQSAGGEDAVGATITVAEPWEGYAAMSEEQILDRLTGADSGVRVAVRLYEGMNANRQQIIFATDDPVASGG